MVGELRTHKGNLGLAYKQRAEALYEAALYAPDTAAYILTIFIKYLITIPDSCLKGQLLKLYPFRKLEMQSNEKNMTITE